VLERDRERARELSRLRREASRELSKAITSMILDDTTSKLRHEWPQMQVVAHFMPFCMVCERPVGAVHLVCGGRDRLCLDCFDAWADPDLETMEEDTPASFELDRLAEEARERESARRQTLVEEEGAQLRVVGDEEVPQESDAERRCWRCGGSTTRAPLGHEWDAVEITLGVMALVPNASQPAEGRVCLGCLAWEVGRQDWKALGQVLQDPGRRAAIKAEARRAEQGGAER
jgi:hypothetical protein